MDYKQSQGFRSYNLLSYVEVHRKIFENMRKIDNPTSIKKSTSPLKDIVDDEGSPNVRDGDIIVFERRKGDFVSTLLAILTGESYTHAALVEDKNKGKAGEKQELVIREATSIGSEHRTDLKDYKSRRFKDGPV